MTKYSLWGAWLIVGLYLAQVALGVFVGHYLVSLPLTWASLALIVFAVFFIGTRLRGLNNIVHECSHLTFSANREDNFVIGKFCSTLLTGCFTKYRRDHLSHHAHLGVYEQDNELGAIEKFGLHEPLSISTIARHIVTPLLGLHLRVYSGASMSSEDGRLFLVMKIALLVAIGLAALVQPLTTLLFVVVPLFYVFPTLNFWTDCLDHAGLVGAEDELDASRNVLAPTILQPLLFPRNDCYHLVHHLFPGVPARHLKAAHKQLSEDSAYRSQPLAVKRACKGAGTAGGAAIKP